MCVPSMGTWYRRYHIIPEGASPLHASWYSMLISRKGGKSNLTSEGSETIKSGSDEQEQHKRLSKVDKQAHHCNVPDQQTLFSRCCRYRRKECVITWGDPRTVIQGSQ